MNAAKRKSDKRWEQYNMLVDEITGSLTTTSQVAVLLVCFRHGRGKGYFRVSTRRIAESVGLKKRQTTKIMDDLEHLGVIVLEKEHQGPIPRTYRITFTKANGAVECTNNQDVPPKRMVQCSTDNGAA